MTVQQSFRFQKEHQQLIGVVNFNHCMRMHASSCTLTEKGYQPTIGFSLSVTESTEYPKKRLPLQPETKPAPAERPKIEPERSTKDAGRRHESTKPAIPSSMAMRQSKQELEGEFL